MKNVILMAMLLVGVLFTTGCETKAPEEKAAESVNKAVQDTSNALKDSAYKAKDAIDKALN